MAREQKDRYYLLTARAPRHLTNGEGEIVKTITVPVRFITRNETLIENYGAVPEGSSLERHASRVKRRWDNMVTVAPALEARRQLWISKGEEDVRRELGAGEAEAA